MAVAVVAVVAVVTRWASAVGRVDAPGYHEIGPTLDSLGFHFEACFAGLV